MTFNEYLAGRKPTNDTRGDFVRLAQRDEFMPEISSLRQLSAYVRASAALSGWIEPASRVWRDYEARKARDRRAVLRASGDLR